MKKIILSFIFLCLIPLTVTAPTQGLATDSVYYSEFIEDLPMMADMVEEQDNVVIFDKPSGRIIELKVETKHSQTEVLEFYNGILFNLGWKKLKKNRFLKDDEILSVIPEMRGKKTIVHFTLRPKN